MFHTMPVGIKTEQVNNVTEDLNVLVSQARSGDKGAFGKLVEHYQRRIFAVAYGIVGNRQDAEDLTQEAFIKAYSAIGSLKTDQAFYNWLLRITVNTGINYKKKLLGKSPIPLEQVDELIFPGESPEELAERHDRLQHITALVAELPADHRAVLVLREIEELSYDEIALALDIPLGTVKSRLKYARDKLRQAIIRQKE